jgi:hypothetical protein
MSLHVTFPRRVAQLHAKNKPKQSHRIRPKNVRGGVKMRISFARCTVWVTKQTQWNLQLT